MDLWGDEKSSRGTGNHFYRIQAITTAAGRINEKAVEVRLLPFRQFLFCSGAQAFWLALLRALTIFSTAIGAMSRTVIWCSARRFLEWNCHMVGDICRSKKELLYTPFLKAYEFSTRSIPGFWFQHGCYGNYLSLLEEFFGRHGSCQIVWLPCSRREKMTATKKKVVIMVLRRIIPRLRAAWKDTIIAFRGDSHFSSSTVSATFFVQSGTCKLFIYCRP